LEVLMCAFGYDLCFVMTYNVFSMFRILCFLKALNVWILLYVFVCGLIKKWDNWYGWRVGLEPRDYVFESWQEQKAEIEADSLHLDTSIRY